MSSRTLAWVHLVYGCVAALAGGLGGVAALLDLQTRRGCAGMAYALCAVTLIALAVLGLPQAVVGWMHVRGRPSGPAALRWLSIANLVVNAATIGLFAASGVPGVGLVLLPALAVNVLTLTALHRERIQAAI